MTRMDNEWAKFFTDIDGNLVIWTQSMNIFQRIAEGAIPGYSAVEIYGRNPVVDTGPEDIWDHGGIATFSSTADIDRLSSSDNGDNQNILVVGLDSAWNEVAQFRTLTGQTSVALDPPLIRIHDMRNMGATSCAGDVYSFVNGPTTGGVPDNSTDIRAKIIAGNNRTLMAMRTIPNGKTGYLWDGWAAVSRAGGVTAVSGEFSAWSRLFGGVFAVQASSSTMTTGNSGWDRPYRVPVPIPQRTDILLRADSVSNTCAMVGGFTLMLKENS